MRCSADACQLAEHGPGPGEPETVTDSKTCLAVRGAAGRGVGGSQLRRRFAAPAAAGPSVRGLRLRRDEWQVRTLPQLGRSLRGRPGDLCVVDRSPEARDGVSAAGRDPGPAVLPPTKLSAPEWAPSLPRFYHNQNFVAGTARGGQWHAMR